MGWCVYRHTSPSGKIYIGITSRKPKYRWRKNGEGYAGCSYFYNAILKYGWDNIKHEILLKDLDEETASRIEIDLIRHYKNLGISYNISEGGYGGRKGVHILLTEEWKLKLSNAHKGLYHTKETKLKMSKSRKGKSQTKEWIEKRAANKRVKVEALIGDTWVLFTSIREAAKTLNIEERNISAVCAGKRYTAGKIKFRYYDERGV